MGDWRDSIAAKGTKKRMRSTAKQQLKKQWWLVPPGFLTLA